MSTPGLSNLEASSNHHLFSRSELQRHSGGVGRTSTRPSHDERKQRPERCLVLQQWPQPRVARSQANACAEFSDVADRDWHQRRKHAAELAHGNAIVTSDAMTSSVNVCVQVRLYFAGRQLNHIKMFQLLNHLCILISFNNIRPQVVDFFIPFSAFFC